MKKIASLVVMLMLVSTFGYAQTRKASNFSTAAGFGPKTNFSSISVQGLDRTGNPGYIEFVSTSIAGVVSSHYLWIDITGDLRVSNDSDMLNSVAGASFPTADWGLDVNVGTVVGGQS